MNTISNDSGPAWLPKLRERFGDVSLSGAERLMTIEDAQNEIKTSVQEALYAIAGRLNPKPKKDVDIGELLHRAVDKGDAEARALANLLSTWSGKITVQFTVDLEAPRFVPRQDDLAVWSGLAGSDHPDADKWGVDEVDRTLAAAIALVGGSYKPPSADARDYAGAVVRWPDTMFGPKIGAEISKSVWMGCDGNALIACTERLEIIARRLNLVRHAPPPEGFLVLTPRECVLPDHDAVVPF